MNGNENYLNEIFDLLRSGDRKAGVRLLYEKGYDKMYGIAFSVTKKEDASRDVVQNVVYKLLKTNAFPEKGELSWLYTVVKNEALTFLRENKSSTRLEQDLEQKAAIFSTEKDINEFVNMDEFYSMIKGLNEERRQIVTLKVLGGYTHKEIAQMLDKPVGTVQWLYNTSIKSLRAIFSAVITTCALCFFGFAARFILLVVNGGFGGNNSGGNAPNDNATGTPGFSSGNLSGGSSADFSSLTFSVKEWVLLAVSLLTVILAVIVIVIIKRANANPARKKNKDASKKL